MLIRDGKEYRNLEEQVRKNQEDIKYILEEQGVLNEFGIKVVGQIADASQLPSQYTGEFGDAFAVGTTTPYTLYIWTRAFSGQTQPFWFNIGMFPLPSTVPGPQGATGPQGPTGQRGSIWATGNTLPAVVNYLVNDKFLNTANGDVYTLQYNQSTNNKEWVRTGNIRGTQGIQGLTGATGATGPQGETGPQGPQGPKGGIAEIAGVLTSTDQLPAPGSVIPSTAYIITQNGVNNLYIIVDDEWFNAGAFASIQGPQGPAGPTGPQGPAGVNGTNGTLITVGGEYVPTFDMDTKADASSTNEAISGLNTAINSADAQINTLSLHVAQNAANISQLQQFETESTPAINFAESERQKSKNLLTLEQQDYTAHGITVKINKETQELSFNGNGNTVNEGRIAYVESFTLKAGRTYTFSFSKVSGSRSGGLFVYLYNTATGEYTNTFGITLQEENKRATTLTPTTDLTFNAIRWYIDTNTSTTNYTVKLQVEDGTQATEWQYPYGAIVHEKDIQRHIITGSLIAGFDVPNYNEYFTVPFVENERIGNKLTINSNGEVIIGAGVKAILVNISANLYVSAIGYQRLRVYKNNTAIAFKYEQTKDTAGRAIPLDITPFLIEVAEGDIITLRFQSSSLASLQGSNEMPTFMTVEVVE